MNRPSTQLHFLKAGAFVALLSACSGDPQVTAPTPPGAVQTGVTTPVTPGVTPTLPAVPRAPVPGNPSPGNPTPSAPVTDNPTTGEPVTQKPPITNPIPGSGSVAQCANVNQMLSTGIRRLSIAELDRIVEDVFGLPAGAFSKLSGDPIGFQTLGGRLIADSTFTRALVEAGLDIAETVTETDLNAACMNAADLAACGAETLSPYAKRLFRRTLTAEETAQVGSIVALTAAEEGATAQDGLKAGMAYLLSSPKFLYTSPVTPGPARAALGTEIMESLALVLWRSVPTTALIDRAAAGELDTAAGLALVIDEMMADEKAVRFLRSVAQQWLALNALNEGQIDAEGLGIEPAQWSALLPLFVEETTRFLAEIFNTDAPLSTVLTADFSVVNQRLADFYGLGVEVDGWQRVDFPDDSPRRGILSQGSVLATGASGTHASVVRRGVTVLSHLVCQPPPSPPPGLLDAVVAQETDDNLTEQQKMMSRAADPVCAACHVELDAIGFAFFEFDALGRHRTDVDGQPLDTTVTFRGQSVSNSKELSSAIAGVGMEQCATSGMLTMMLGREVSVNRLTSTFQADTCLVNSIQRTAGTDGFRSSVRAALLSEAFRSRLAAN